MVLQKWMSCRQKLLFQIGKYNVQFPLYSTHPSLNNFCQGIQNLGSYVWILKTGSKCKNSVGWDCSKFSLQSSNLSWWDCKWLGFFRLWFGVLFFYFSIRRLMRIVCESQLETYSNWFCFWLVTFSSSCCITLFLWSSFWWNNIIGECKRNIHLEEYAFPRLKENSILWSYLITDVFFHIDIIWNFMHEEVTYSISQRRQKRKIRRIGILFSRLIFFIVWKIPSGIFYV